MDQANLRRIKVVISWRLGDTLDHVTGATVFVDNYSGLTYSYMQTDLDSDQTTLSKLEFEAYTYNMGLRIQSYRAYNGKFLEKGYRDAVSECRQTIDYCGADMHSQNGIVERTIGLMTNDSRTLLL